MVNTRRRPYFTHFETQPGLSWKWGIPATLKCPRAPGGRFSFLRDATHRCARVILHRMRDRTCLAFIHSNVRMHIPLIQRSLRWKMLITLIALFLFFGIAILTIEPPAREARPIKMMLVFALTCGLLIWIVASRISEPLIQLTRAAGELANKNFAGASRLQENRHDEIGQLSRTFRIMAENLKTAQEELEQSLDEIRHAEKRLSLFFEQCTDMIGMADYDTRILEVNPAFHAVLGYAPGEIKGISYLDLVHPDDLAASREAVKQLSDGKNLIAFENRFRCRDGSYRLIAWNVASHPELRTIYATGRDITEKRKLEDAVVRAATAEQERIARDLHDSLGQMMTGLAFKAKLIEAELRDGRSPPAALAAELVALANRAGDEARALARGVDPVQLQHGLGRALEYLAIYTSENLGTPCTFTGDRGVDEIEKSKSTHLYRIAQEAVNNAVKHGQPAHIHMRLERKKNTIQLTVADDGVGTNNAPGMVPGQGLRIMEYRARLMGGTLSVEPAESGGLVVSCTVPAAGAPEENCQIAIDMLSAPTSTG